MADVYKVDQTFQVVNKVVKARKTSSWSLPTSVWILLFLCVAYWGTKAWRAVAYQSKMGRYKLEKRRRHGIPDSDDRPFKIALLDVVARQQVEEQARADENAKLQVEESMEWTRWGESNGMRDRKGKVSASRPLLQPAAPSSPPEILSPYTRSSSRLPSPPAFSFGRQGSVASSHDGNQGSERMTGVEAFEFGSGSILRPSSSSSSSNARASHSRPQADSTSSHTLSSSSQRRPSSSTVTRAAPASYSRRSSNASKPSAPAGKKRGYVEDSDEEDLDEEDEEEIVVRGGGKRRRQADSEREGRDDMEISEEENEGSIRSDEMDEDSDDALVKPEPSRRSRQTSMSSDFSDSTQSTSRAGDYDDNLSDDSMTSPSPPPPSKSKKNKRVLSEVDAESTVSGRTNSRRQNKRNKSQSNAADITSSVDEDEEKPEKTWNDPNGIRFRIRGGERERLVLVKKMMRKYGDMPLDSTHPDRDVMIVGNVEQWVTEPVFITLKASRSLAWQTDEDEENAASQEGTSTPLKKEIDGESEPGFDTLTPKPARLQGLYHVTGPSTTPLRPSSSFTSLHNSFSSSFNNSPLRASSSQRGSPAAGPGSGSGTPGSAGGRLRLAGSTRGRASIGGVAQRAVGEEEKRRREEVLLGRLRKELEKEQKKEPEKEASTAWGGMAPVQTPALTVTPATATGASSPSNPFSFGAPAATPLAAKTQGPSTTTTLTPATVRFSNKTEPPAKAAIPSFFSKTTPSVLSPPAPTPVAASPAPPASNPFSFGAPKALTSALANAPPITASSVTPSLAPIPTSTPGGFSFGAPPSTSSAPHTPAPTPATSGPSFSFGAPSAAKVEPPKPAPSTGGFSFGAPKPAETRSASPAPFSFGALSTATLPTSAPATPPITSTPSTFSFGGGGAASTPLVASTPSAPSFSFGAGSLTNPAAAPPMGKTFSFDSSNSTTVAQPSATPSDPFGSKPVASIPTPSSSSFSFGAPSGLTSTASAPTSRTGSPAPFSFGSGGGAASAAGPPRPASSGFSFGAPAASTPPANRGAVGFSFGASAPAASAASAPGAFTFGAGAGAGAPAAPAAAPGAFTFGGGGGGFSFGKK